ncbi:hypothetical protein CF132_18675 [Aeromonas dhakensis]|nr:hypothetical protein CF132_18675 [Aeromonas dhakensis]
MNIFPIQDGAGDRHFKGTNTTNGANGDFCANRGRGPILRKQKTRRGGFWYRRLSRDAGPVEEQRLTQLRGWR